VSDSIYTRHARCVRILREWRTIWKRQSTDAPRDSAAWVAWVLGEIRRLEQETDDALAAEHSGSGGGGERR